MLIIAESKQILIHTKYSFSKVVIMGVITFSFKMKQVITVPQFCLGVFTKGNVKKLVGYKARQK